MEIDEEYIDKVKSFIEQKDAENVKALLIDLHPADIAELCNDLAPEEARFVYRLLDNETAADVLVEMDEDVRKEFLELLPSETIAKRFVDYMDTDDAVDLMRDLDEEKKEEVLSHIEDIEQAGDIVDLLKYAWCLSEFQYEGQTVFMAPASGFYTTPGSGRNEVRIAYVLKKEDLIRALFVLSKALEAYPGRTE